MLRQAAVWWAPIVVLCVIWYWVLSVLMFGQPPDIWPVDKYVAVMAAFVSAFTVALIVTIGNATVNAYYRCFGRRR